MIIIKLFCPIIVLVIALIQIALQHKWRKWGDGRTKVHKRVIKCLIGLMIIGTFFTCGIIVKDVMESLVLVDKVNALLISNTNLQKQVQLKSEQILSLSQTNIDITKKAYQYITGDNSYCYIMVFKPMGYANILDFDLIKTGKQPLYDISILIRDGTK